MQYNIISLSLYKYFEIILTTNNYSNYNITCDSVSCKKDVKLINKKVDDKFFSC